MQRAAMPSRRWAPALALACAFVAAGCTDGGTSPSGAPATPSVTAAHAASPQLQAILDDERRATGAPGALARVRTEGIDWTGSSGSADRSATPLAGDATFRIASISKTITAALTLDAVERGELHLDDSADAIVPDLLRDDQPVTVRMLLDHTSGIFNAGDEGDIVDDITRLTDPALVDEADDLLRRYTAGERMVVPDRLWIALAETHDRYFAPGAGFHYSNVNYQVLGLVLEAVTGQSLTELLHSRITGPLGLSHTSLVPSDPTRPGLHGYTRSDDGSLTDSTDELLAVGNGAGGGVVSTTDELLTIMRAIVTGSLFGPDLADQMRRPTAASDGSYGLGLATYQLSCGTFLGHGGALAGTLSIALVSPDGTDGAVVALGLRADEDPDVVALADRLLCSAIR